MARRWKPQIRMGVFCQKIVFRLGIDIPKTRCLLAVCLDSDDYFLYFKTNRGQYQVRRGLIESITPTDVIFRTGDSHDY